MDKSSEPVSLKKVGLGRCLSGRALEDIRGLGVSEHQNDEAKEILQSKFSEQQQQQLRGYMDEQDNMPRICNNDVDAFESLHILCR